MKTPRPLIYAVLMVLIMAPAAWAGDKAAHPDQGGPATTHQATFPITVQAGDYALKTLVFDFAPGAAVPPHMHGGYVLATVLNGEMTLTDKGAARVIKTGESWTEDPGAVHSAMNAGAVPARVAVTMLLPKGAEATKMVTK